VKLGSQFFISKCSFVKLLAKLATADDDLIPRFQLYQSPTYRPTTGTDL